MFLLLGSLGRLTWALGLADDELLVFDLAIGEIDARDWVASWKEKDELLIKLGLNSIFPEKNDFIIHVKINLKITKVLFIMVWNKTEGAPRDFCLPWHRSWFLFGFKATPLARLTQSIRAWLPGTFENAGADIIWPGLHLKFKCECFIIEYFSSNKNDFSKSFTWKDRSCQYERRPWLEKLDEWCSCQQQDRQKS